MPQIPEGAFYKLKGLKEFSHNHTIQSHSIHSIHKQNSRFHRHDNSHTEVIQWSFKTPLPHSHNHSQSPSLFISFHSHNSLLSFTQVKPFQINPFRSLQFPHPPQHTFSINAHHILPFHPNSCLLINNKNKNKGILIQTQSHHLEMEHSVGFEI